MSYRALVNLIAVAMYRAADFRVTGASFNALLERRTKLSVPAPSLLVPRGCLNPGQAIKGHIRAFCTKASGRAKGNTVWAGLTIQLLHLDPTPDGTQVVAQVQCACRLHPRQHSPPARCNQLSASELSQPTRAM